MQIPKFLIRKSHTLCDLNITKSFFKAFPAFSMILKRETRRQAHFNMQHTHKFNSTVFFVNSCYIQLLITFKRCPKFLWQGKILFSFLQSAVQLFRYRKKDMYVKKSSPFLSTNHVWNFISRGYSFHDNPLHLPPQC